MTVFLVRHAQAGSRIGAALDDDRLRTLTVEGRHQSAELAGILAVLGVTEILTSPYRRCIETAAPLAAALNVEVQITTALQEGPHDGALALVRQLASGSAAFFSHGDIIPGVLQSLAQEDNLDLGESPMVAPGAAVSQADVEIAVGPELQLSPVVIGEGLGLGEQDLFARCVGTIGVGAGDAVAGDHRHAALGIRVVHVEVALAAIPRRKRDAEQTTLPVRAGPGSDIEKRLAHQCAIAHDAHDTVLLDQKEALGSILGGLNVHGVLQPLCHAHQPDLRLLRPGERHGEDQQREDSPVHSTLG